MTACLSIVVDPPAIVAPAELSEEQLVQNIAQAANRDDFAIGRFALQWHRQYSRGRSDAALARMINETNPDAGVSSEFIRSRRIVAKVFPNRLGTRSTTHHVRAIELAKDNARTWLERAEENQWSVAEMRRAILADAAHNEKDIIQQIITASLDPNDFDRFAVGRLAHLWQTRHANRRFIGDLADLVFKASNHKVDFTHGDLRALATVAAVTPTRVGNLSWPHHRIAAEAGGNAEEWLLKAEAEGWTADQLHRATTREWKERHARLPSQPVRTIRQTTASLMARCEKIEENRGDVLKHRNAIVKMVHRLREGCDAIEGFLERKASEDTHCKHK